MSSALMPLLLRWRNRLVPDSLGLGWMPVFTLGYLLFLFVPFVVGWLADARGGWVGEPAEVLGPTLLSIVVFLPLYFASFRFEGAARPVCMLAIAAVGYALIPVNPFGNTYIIYAVAIAAGVGRSLWPRVAWAFLILAGMLVETLVLRIPPFVFVITLLVGLGAFFGQYQFIENLRKRAELKLSHDEVRRLATVAERERIGRDLHDLLGHTLSLVALKSDLAGKLLARGEGDDARAAEARAAAQREIAEVSRVAREALAQVRLAVTGIRAAGIAAELVSAKLLLETDGVAFASQVDPRWLEGGALRAEVETALAMTVREAVTNIQRHARARKAVIELETIGGDAVLRIIDDGRGSDIVPGNGLGGMRERIEALGGRLRIDSRRGEGTRIEARLPLQAGHDLAMAVNA